MATPPPAPSAAETGSPMISVPKRTPQRRTAARYGSLLRTLTFTEFKLRYAHSALGYVWTLSKPLMLFGVMYVVFSRMLRFGAGIPNFPIILLMGIMLWGFFSEATTGAVVVLVSRADMLRKASFPRSVLPVSVVGTSLLVLACNLVALGVFIAIARMPERIEWLLLPPLLLELTVLAVGTSLLLSGLYVYMRDIGQLWAVLLQLAFYATPIIYPLELLRQNGVSEDTVALLLLNPMAQIVQDARWALAGGAARPAHELQGALWFGPYAIVLVLFVGGLLTYRRYATRMAEHV